MPEIKLIKDLNTKQFSMQNMIDFAEHCERNSIIIDLDYALIQWFEDRAIRLNNLLNP